MERNAIDFNRIFFGRHRHGHKSATAAILVFVAIMVVYTYLSQNAMSTETQTARTAQQSPYADVCSAYPASDAKVSCEDAVNTALLDTQGELLYVNKSSMRIDYEKEPGKRAVETKPLWTIGIRLREPKITGTKTIENMEIFVDIDSNAILKRQVL